MLSAEYHLTLTLGPVELEQWPATRRQELERLAEVRTPDLVGLAQLVRENDLLISNESGPAHLAALLGTPTLTLFGPTRAATWRPIGAAAQVIQGEAALGDDWGIKAEAVHAAATAIVNGLSFPLHPDV